MTEHGTLNTVIHAAFRRDLRRFDDALAAFPAGSRERAGQLGVAWDNLEFQLHHHHADEEQIFWPAMSKLGFANPLAADLQGEHAAMLGALDAASAAMAILRDDPTAANAATARAQVAALSDVLLGHLEHEERDLEPLAVAHADGPEMKTARKAVQKAHQGDAGVFFAWLSDGADADALAGIRREVPPPVLFVLRHTSGRRYARTIAPTWARAA